MFQHVGLSWTIESKEELRFFFERHWILVGDPGGPTVPHHFQYGDVRSGESMDLIGGGRDRTGGGGR